MSMQTQTREKLLGKTQYRSIEGTVSGIDPEKRTVELSFSSETEVERWWGNEILDHGESAVRMGRLLAAAPLLVDHSIRDQVGVVERAWISKDEKKGRATVRFSRSVRAQEIFQDVQDGIRKNVSVGYIIHNLVLQEKREDVKVYRVTDWEPMEITLTAVPADNNVGVGRGLDDPPLELPENPNSEKLTEPEKNQGRSVVTMAGEPNRNQENLDSAATERKRTMDILAMGEQFGMRAEAQAAIREGASVDCFRANVLEKVHSKNQQENRSVTSDLGMTPKEMKNFSLVRALNAVLSDDWSKAPYEREVSNAVALKRGALDKGFYVPTELLLSRKAEVTTTTSPGLIAEEYRPSEFIEILREKTVVRKLGARFLTGLVGNLAIPRQTVGGEAHWLEEEGEPDQSKWKTDQIPMSPRTLGAFYDLSRKVLLQSSPDVEQFVRNELASIIAIKIDKTALGLVKKDLAMKGILLQEGIQQAGINRGSGGSGGFKPINYETLCELEGLIASKNADAGEPAFLANAGGRFRLRQERETPSSPEPLWRSINRNEASLLGYTAHMGNVLSPVYLGDETTLLDPLIFGVWSQAVIGEWGVMSVTADPYSLSKSGGLRLVLHHDLDMIIRHPESFAVAYAPASLRSPDGANFMRLPAPRPLAAKKMIKPEIDNGKDS